MILAMADQYCVNRLKALCELHIGEMVEETSEESVAKLNVVGKYNMMGYGNYSNKDVLSRLTALCSITQCQSVEWLPASFCGQ